MPTGSQHVSSIEASAVLSASSSVKRAAVSNSGSSGINASSPTFAHVGMMAQAKRSTAIAEAIGKLELEKIIGPAEFKTVKVASFWQDKPAVIHILRRFGCPLCRGNALELSKIIPILEQNGVRVVAVGIEKVGADEFVKGRFWNGSEIYVDNGKKIHQALQIKSVGAFAALKMMFIDKSVKEAYKKYSSLPHNITKGDGQQLGATFVLDKGGAVLMDFRQKNFADNPSNESILEALGLDPALASKGDQK